MATVYLGTDPGKEFRAITVAGTAPARAIVLAFDDAVVKDEQQLVVALRDFANYLAGADWPPPATV